MSSYRLVLLATLVTAVLLVTLLAVLNTAGQTDLLSGVIIVETLADIVATGYVLRLVIGDQRRPRSWLLLAIFTTTLINTVGILPIGYTVVRRYLGQPPLPAGLGLLLVGMGLVLIGLVPVMKAVLFFLVNAEDKRAKTRAMRRRSTDVPDEGGPAELMAVPFVHRLVKTESAAIEGRVSAIRHAKQTERLIAAAQERLGRQ